MTFAPIVAEMSSCNSENRVWEELGTRKEAETVISEEIWLHSNKGPPIPHLIHIPHLVLLLLLLFLSVQNTCYEILYRTCLLTLGPIDGISILLFKGKNVIIRKILHVQEEKSQENESLMYPRKC